MKNKPIIRYWIIFIVIVSFLASSSTSTVQAQDSVVLKIKKIRTQDSKLYVFYKNEKTNKTLISVCECKEKYAEFQKNGKFYDEVRKIIIKEGAYIKLSKEEAEPYRYIKSFKELEN